ncbi:expressed unknown protein [Seminavis robusta]|uniref:Uncharacterized protein n=1 Tax=Seminavis robusta TaxID=568900 RepID=A0A9N8H6T1_9STRA|nr:expressed unknown protein [Seminavis robusta]|eukprot:Sro109_g054590.1 n/a (223) ;mRNA; r:72173-72841
MEGINYYLFLAAMENREGALNLAKGNVAEALEILENAVHILDQLAQLPEILQFNLQRPHYCVSVALPFLQEQDPRYFAYSRALIFSPLIGEVCCIQEIAYYRAVALFNIGMAHQMKGKVLKCIKSQRKAIRFFDSCLSAIALLPIGSQDTDLLRVAALNNKAVILSDMMDFDQAKLALDEVRGKWRHALAQQLTEGAFVRKDIEGFILNTMESVPPTAAACA